MTARTKERIFQSKQARAVSLAIVDKPQVGRTLYPPGAWFADVISSFSGVTCVFLFCFVFVFTPSLKPRGSFVLRSSTCMHPDSHTRVSSFFAFSLGMSLYPSFFYHVTVFSSYGEYVARFLLPGGV